MKTTKTIIYQTFPRLFGNFNEKLVENGNLSENGCGKFNSYTDKALEEIKSLGITHVWFTGILRHATCTDYSSFGLSKDHSAIVKGKAGSPYAIKDYYDLSPDLAENVKERMSEFEALVQRTHDAGMKVVMDFVPNHVARSYQSQNKPAYIDDLGHHDRKENAFDPMNNFYYFPGQSLVLHCVEPEEDYEYSEFPAKATGNDCFSVCPSCNDWYETVKLNYGIDYCKKHKKYFAPIPDTWNKMLDILLFWVGKNIDGFRCDMAEMVPVEFWSWVIPKVKSRKNVLFIAEVYNQNSYRDFISKGKFDLLYDKVGMYDTLRNIICGKSPANELNSSRYKTEDIQANMLYFLENHDEQRIASEFFSGNPETGIPAFAYLSMFNTNPVMLYNGQELGERGMDKEGFSGRDGRTSIFDYWNMESVRKWANNGKFDGEQLSEHQRFIRNEYKKILNIVNSEKAFAEGLFYGLDFCNENNDNFRPDKMTCFLRKCENDLILVVINFDDKEHDIRINISENAFEVLDVKDNTPLKQIDLATGEESITTLTCKNQYQISIKANNYKSLKFNSLWLSK
jgi:glycosidase